MTISRPTTKGRRVLVHGSSWPRNQHDELNVTQKENELLINGRAQPSAQEKQYLYRGIAGRDFERIFQLADHIKVVGARLADGMLTIELKREIPEEKKARPIRIDAEPSQRTITQH